MPTATRSIAAKPSSRLRALKAELAAFAAFGTSTLISEAAAQGQLVPQYVNEFWTAKQRAASSIHEVSYRACFKPQLPRFFIQRLTQPGHTVHDPFMGRGTTLIEAALMGRHISGTDVNPLSLQFIRPRLALPSLAEITQRLREIDLASVPAEENEDLQPFYHPEVLRGLCSLKHYFAIRHSDRDYDSVDDFIRLLALTRLSGHSAGFFSVYSLPPNQAVSPASQRKINAKRQQTPPLRDIPQLLLKKAKQLLADITPADAQQLRSTQHQLLTCPADAARELPAASAQLIVTSPPFLDVVDYAGDNWLRCWFLGIDPDSVKLSQHRKLTDWLATMTRVFTEQHRILQPGGFIAFEVGDLAGDDALQTASIQAGTSAGLTAELVLVNAQEFTKTANCWGVANNAKGTNTNRIVLFSKPL